MIIPTIRDRKLVAVRMGGMPVSEPVLAYLASEEGEQFAYLTQEEMKGSIRSAALRIKNAASADLSFINNLPL